MKVKKHKKSSNKIEKTVEQTPPEVGNANDNSDDDDVEFIEPSTELLKKSEDAKYQYNVKSGRTKKKEKHNKLLVLKKNICKEKDNLKNIEYLTKWKLNRANWKFEKLRQISITSTLFDDTKLNDENFKIALEYLSGSKGQAKDNLIKLAELEINKLDEEIENTKNKNLVNAIQYRRAREILQSLE